MSQIPRSSLNSIPLSYATVSVGTPVTPLPQKLTAISKAGFTGIELGFPDLLSFASTHHGRKIPESDYDSLSSAGQEVATLCQNHNLKIMMLQPFSNFEGWPQGSKEREDAFTRARGWIKIMGSLGCDMLQVGSSDSPASKITTVVTTIANDLRELADMLAQNSYRLAYENWCWSTHAPTWKQVWEIVKLVDRPNVGLCLDTFQTIGSEYADPTTKSGLRAEDGAWENLEVELRHSLEELRTTVPKEKIFLLQLSDAYKLSKPLAEDGPDGEGQGEDGLRARGRWSHDYRPYFYNGGGYTKECVEMCKAVLDTGLEVGGGKIGGEGRRCWFSYEVFDAGPEGKGGSGTGMCGDKEEMEKFCEGAFKSAQRMFDECADKP